MADLYRLASQALEICREATKAVFDNKALVLLPLLSTMLGMVVVVYSGMAIVNMLTPDPITINQQLVELTHDLTETTVELTETTVELTEAAVDDAVALSNALFEKASTLASNLSVLQSLEIGGLDTLLENVSFADVRHRRPSPHPPFRRRRPRASLSLAARGPRIVAPRAAAPRAYLEPREALRCARVRCVCSPRRRCISRGVALGSMRR